MEKKKWQSYEEVAEYLLNQFSETFGLGTVEGKQIISGGSGTNWEIDAKGIKTDGEGFLIVECRCHMKSRLSQESVGALAYRIKDTGAEGGIIVSPLELQKGAKIIAHHDKIHHIILDPKSTATDFILKFLKEIFIGRSEQVQCKDTIDVKVIQNGKVIEERHID